MLRIVSETKENERIVLMKDMKPFQAGRVVGSGHIVMRTAATSKFEVMDLTNHFPDSCWTGCPNLAVQLLDSFVMIEIDGQ